MPRLNRGTDSPPRTSEAPEAQPPGSSAAVTSSIHRAGRARKARGGGYDKTHLIEFGRFADSNRRQRGGGKPETFAFLGLTHSCAKTRAGKFTVLRQTMRQRWRAKLEEVKTELRRRLHDPVPEQGAYSRSVVTGHVPYYGVPLNGPALNDFRYAIGWIRCRMLRRRRQRHHITAHRIRRLVSRWLPTPRICHPYPLVRLGVVIQGGSRMR